VPGRRRAHTQQAQAARQVDALEALAGARRMTGVVGRLVQGEVARDGAEVVEAQLDADGAAR
jgi:predicted Abi (CAAX) family protease